MMNVVLVLAVLFLGPVLGSEIHLKTVLAVTRCRAACLDKFIHLIRDEENCHKEPDCFMCWETCKMLNENFKIWGPMCSVPDICFPGCQSACNSITQNNDAHNNISMPVELKSVCEPQTDRVTLEWMPEELESNGTILYVSLLRNANEEWHQVALTTSHIVHMKRNMLEKETRIRLLAANATHQLCDTETTFLNSLIVAPDSKSPVALERTSWKLHLESMEQSDTSAGILARITWPKVLNDNGDIPYEVSWNVIDDSMEITGHLYTVNSEAVLTLWPESLYSIQVSTRGSEDHLSIHSEPLLINTNVAYRTTGSATREGCKTEVKNPLNIFACAFLLVTPALLFTCAMVLYMKRREFYIHANYKGHIETLNGIVRTLSQKIDLAHKGNYFADSEKLLHHTKSPEKSNAPDISHSSCKSTGIYPSV